MARGDKKILDEAKKRFKQCEEWESRARELFNEDLKFAEADPDNHWQWPDSVFNDRFRENRPCLTINKVRQHNLKIINDAKQNKPAIVVKPTGDGATYEAAQVYSQLIRRIEYQSNAQTAYDSATAFQVKAGIGYFRILTEYADDRSFDQDVFIRPVKDPLSVYLDPDIQEVDGSDARFGFIFEDMPRDEFEAKYPELKEDQYTCAPLGNSKGNDWRKKDRVRLAEYYRLTEVKRKLLAFVDPHTGQQTIITDEHLPADIRDAMLNDPATKSRDVVDHKLEWFKIAGEKIIDRTEPPGSYIPICRVIGEESVIDGVLDRKGHTRALKDPQRMYNYWSSGGVEFGAMQTKSPWLIDPRSIEGYEGYWAASNRVNFAYLPYKALGDQAEELPRPERADPPTYAPAFAQGMEIATNEIQMASGQYEAQMGQESNERSGKAIQQRQRQGDNATYHFIDNLAIALRHAGKILIQWIPQVYDTERVQKIMAEDGTETQVQIDPSSKQALKKSENGQQQAEVIFNPNVGKYEVEADVGPAYATRRQEQFNALSTIMAQNPDAMKIAGDLLFKSADFPGAEQLAERWRNSIPPQILNGGAPPPELVAANETVQKLQGLMSKTIAENAALKLKLQGKDADKSIAAYQAETDRINVLADADYNLHEASLSEKDIASMLHDVQMQERATHLGMMEKEHSAAIDQATQPDPAQQNSPV